MEGVLVPDYRASSSVVPSNAIVGAAAAMKAASAGRARAAVVAPASAAPFAVTAGLLLAALIFLFGFFVLPLVFHPLDLLILKMGVPVALHILVDIVFVTWIRGIERVHPLVVRQPVLHFARERIPDGL